MISIVSKLYETDFKVESTWWNVNGFAWLTCLLSHFEKLINGESDLQYYWWNNGAFIEVKYTNATEQIIKADNNDYQVLRYIDVLKRLEEAYTTKSKIAASFSIGSKIKKNASNSGGAFLHLITPYGVTIDEEIKKKAGANNIFLYHSTMEYKETSSFIDKYAFRVKLGELINIDYLSNYHKGVIIRKFADGNGTTGAWDNQ